MHGFPTSEYNLKSLEWLPRPCVNRFSLHFLISSPNILSLSTPLQPPRPPCWSKSCQAHSHAGPVHLLSFLLKWSSTSYVQLLLDLSKSLLKYHHVKRPNVALLSCPAFFVFMVHVTYLYPHTYIYCCLFSVCHLSTPHTWLQSLFIIFYLFCCSCFTALFYPLYLEQSGIWQSFNKYFWVHEQVAWKKGPCMEFCC